MISHCHFCKKKHEDLNWKSHFIEGKLVTYCSKYFRVGGYPEFTTKSVKEQRESRFKTLLQPYRGGELSKEYVEAYGTKGIGVTKEQASKAKYVYKDLKGWNSRHKSK